MAIDVLLGLQWGDEGKGKIVDTLTPKYDIIARFQGGPNAGHTLVFDDINHVTHTIPSGIFHENCENIVGNGVVIDPVIFKREIEELENLGVDVRSKLKVSKKAHLIVPTHRLLDQASERSKGESKIGSTLKGIGPTYMDKTGRNGLRFGDIQNPDFKENYSFLIKKHSQILKFYHFDYDLTEIEKEWFDAIDSLRSIELIDSEHYINNANRNGKSTLAEGAQGTLLDIDFGSYPFVTSSNTISAGACTGLGIAPGTVGKVIGIFKAYCTRVGSGPFPTELFDKTGKQMQDAGHEYGATTGRPRRCGWLDLPALKYAVMINGATELIITKADVLSNFDVIKVCTHYQTENGTIDYLPFEQDGKLDPVYKEFPAWQTDLTGLEHQEQLPEELIKYVNYIEEELEIPITMVSVGPDRKQLIKRELKEAKSVTN
jgi:adenylosuccinate synthase